MKRNYYAALSMLLIFTFWGCSKEEVNKNKIVINADLGKDTISRFIYGNFAEHLGHCIYGGVWVGPKSKIPNTRGIRNDVIEALKAINLPVLRWPGGCFADNYHWMDGIGPAEKRPKTVNASWGGVVEDNAFGTHEFLDFCDLIGAEPYFAINVGSGSVYEAQNWINYICSDSTPMANLRRQNGRNEPWKVKFWGIGNESWGCGGNMTPAFYADLYKQFSTFCPGAYKVMSGGIDMNWVEVMMKKIQNYKNLAQGFSFHYYTITHNWTHKGSATDFTKDEWFLTMKSTLNMANDLKKTIDIMDKYDPERKIGLIADEWGNWFDVEPGTNPAFLHQQNTLRDAVTAGIYLNIFNNNCQRVKMANIAQLANVLQAVILTKESDIVLTPTYYVFKMYKVHQDAQLLPSKINNCVSFNNGKETLPALNVSSSKDKNGKIHISIVNLDPANDQELSCDLKNVTVKNISGEIITADKMNAMNDFSKSEEVNIQPFTKATLQNNVIKLTIPAKSVITLEVY